MIAKLPLLFKDSKLKWPFELGDSKRRTLEKIRRLVKVYFPKDWLLVLCGLSSTI